MVEESIIVTIKAYLAGLHELGIHADKAVLFGSFANGKGGEYSDIDLIVIAPEFDDGHEVEMVKKLWKATRCDNRIEPIACGEQEWESDQSRPIIEIARREGIVIAA